MELFLLNLFADIQLRVEIIERYQREAYTTMTTTNIDIHKIFCNSDKRFTHCGYCGCPLGKRFCIDHDHYPPYNFRSLACCNHNLMGRIPLVIPVVAHNAQYDISHIVPSLHKLEYHDIDVLPKTQSKFLALIVKLKTKIGIVQVRFIDSMSYLSASLSKMTEVLYENGKGIDKFPLVQQIFKNEIEKNGVSIDEILHKSLFPYRELEIFDDLRKTNFHEPHMYYNDLTEEDIDQKELERAITIWEKWI